PSVCSASASASRRSMRGNAIGRWQFVRPGFAERLVTRLQKGTQVEGLARGPLGEERHPPDAERLYPFDGLLEYFRAVEAAHVGLIVGVGLEIGERTSGCTHSTVCWSIFAPLRPLTLA